MSYTRKFVRKNKDGSVKTYYAEVESLWVNGRAVQHSIRYSFKKNSITLSL